MEKYIYLDQNIIQYIYDGHISLKKNDDFCYVYSDEHFNEINRSEDERFFNTLRQLETRKINVKLDSGFNIIDEAIVLKYEDPKILYDDYIERMHDKKKYFDSFMKIQPYLLGNKEAINPKEIKEGFFNYQMELLNETTEVQMPTEFLSLYKEIMKQLSENFANTLTKLKDKILPIEQLRKKITPVNLSELKFDDNTKKIDQIWETIKKKNPELKKEQFFDEKPLFDSHITEEPLFLTIAKFHCSLNILGYFPDKGLTKTSKIYGINSDAVHLANAIYCSGIISADDHLCKKAIVIYEYFDIQTKVIQVKFIEKKEA